MKCLWMKIEEGREDQSEEESDTLDVDIGRSLCPPLVQFIVRTKTNEITFDSDALFLRLDL